MTNMTEDEIIQQLREMRYPNDIDVTGAVIARISKTPLQYPFHTLRKEFLSRKDEHCYTTIHLSSNSHYDQSRFQ